MATNADDVFAPLRVPNSNPRPAPQQSDDPFAPLRVQRPGPVENRNSLGEEFAAGLSGGIDNTQASLYGLAGLVGRELGIGWMEEAGNAGAARNFEEAEDSGRESAGFTDIESAGGFFKWSAAALGEAVPSLAAMATGGGIGAVVGKKSVELAVKKSLAKRVERRLVNQYGFSREDSLRAAQRYMMSAQGQRVLARTASQPRSAAVIAAASRGAAKTGAAVGAVGTSAGIETGAIDQELIQAGQDPGLSSLIFGVASGGLDALPALRLMKNLFPGVETEVAKAFVKDFMVAAGKQFAFEGTTESLQEVIHVAAQAYHDPTVDMLSPENKKRYIDSFAAGALVGAVTGGATDALGAVANRKKPDPPKRKNWQMPLPDKALPNNFDAADNDTFQGIRSRVFGTVAPHVERAVNSMGAQVQSAFETIHEAMDGGMDEEVSRIADLVAAKQDQFLEEFGPQIEKVQTYIDEQSQLITQTAKNILDPAERQRYIDNATEAMEKAVAPFVQKVEAESAKRDSETTAEVDNMDFDEDLLDQLGIEEQVEETERRTGPSGRTFERSVGPAVQQESSVVPQEGTIQAGETQAAPTMTFGFMQAVPQVGVDGKTSVKPYPNKKAAIAGRGALGRRFLGGRKLNKDGYDKKLKDLFRIVKVDGGYNIEVIDPGVKEDQKFFTDMQHVFESFRRVEGTNNGRKIELGEFNGHKFGYPSNTKNMNVDVQTMAYKGKNIDPNASTDMEGFLAFAGEMLSRGMITNAQFNKAVAHAETYFAQQSRDATKTQNQISDDIQKTEAALDLARQNKDKKAVTELSTKLAALQTQQKTRESFDARAERAKREEGDRDVRGNAPPVNYATEGQAFAALSEFKEELAQAHPELVREHKANEKPKTPGQRIIPKNLFSVVQQADGTWSWGFNGTNKIVRAFRQAKPGLFTSIQKKVDAKRRDEFVDQQTRQEGAFSVNAIGDAGGNLGDPTGATAGAPDAVVSHDARVQERLNDPGAPLPNDFLSTDQRDFAEVTSGFGTRMSDPNDPNSGNQRVATQITETPESIQASDQATDPAQLEPEFEADRAEQIKGESSPKNKQTSARAKKPNPKTKRGRAGFTMEQTEKDNRNLKRWARPGSVKVLLEGIPKDTVAAVTSLANFVTKKLGLSNQITVLSRDSLALLIERGAVSDPAFQELLDDPNVPARNIRIDDNSFIYLSPKMLSDPVTATLAFGHELGHHVYRVAWDKLTPAARDRLRYAYNEATGRSAPGGNTNAEIERNFATWEQGFNEWMADQLAAWITHRRAPKGAVESFFAKVGGQIRRLYDFIKGNPRFQLNETFAQFADAVALKAAAPVDSTANPFAAERIRSWFKSDGATMYAHFGRNLEQDNMDFVPMTADGKKALARIMSKYPAIAARAVTLQNWVSKAYDLVLAPSTSVIRSMPYKSAKQLVRMFNRRAPGKARKGQNYQQALNLARGQLTKRVTAVVNAVEARVDRETPGLSKKERGKRVNAELEKMGQSLHAKDSDPNATFTAEEQMVRDALDAMHAYATKYGKLPVKFIRNYFPRTYSRSLLEANKQKILDHLTVGKNIPLDKARRIFNYLTDPHANDGRATNDATETPGYTAMNSRNPNKGVAGDPFFDQFLESNVQAVLANYVNQVTKRAEFNRRLGEPFPATEISAQDAIREGLWDPKGRMHRLLKAAKDEGATDEELKHMEMYIDANLGQLGRDDLKPGLRKFMAGVMAYQNMRVLMFTVFASLPDTMGPAIRRGDMRGSWNTLKKNIHEMASDDSQLAKMARAYGITQDAMSDHMMTEYVDNHYMPPKLRAMNDAFFKWTGLNWYTDFTRKMALANGIDYLQQSYEDSLLEPNPNTDGPTKAAVERKAAKGKAALAELGLVPEQVKKWLEAGKPTYDSQSHEFTSDTRKIAEALVQFVDESIMRPNASQRPLLASHPAAMLAYHLKGYMFAVYDITLKRMKYNIDQSKNATEFAAAIAPAIGMMVMTAVGLELRELIQYAGSNRKPPTDRMDGWDYTFELAQRSGLTGIAQIGFDFEGASDRGLSEFAGIGGPALSHAHSIYSKPLTQTIPKAIPIIGQLPAARDALRGLVN